MKKVVWLLLLPLGPVAILVGFIKGLKQGFEDQKIVAYANGKPIRYGDLRKWSSTMYSPFWDRTKH